MCLFRS
ncbi:TPA_asm: UL39.6 dORF 1 [Human alphaherpesvirus 1]|nr:TPA_asm: UL39.6 dORF 1 [Human alphaherpesvirus 1]